MGAATFYTLVIVAVIGILSFACEIYLGESLIKVVSDLFFSFAHR